MGRPHVWNMLELNRLPKNLRDAANAALQPGERILFAAQPDWRSGWFGLLMLFAFGAFWTSIAMIFFVVSSASVLGIKPMLSNGQPAGFGLSIFMVLFSLPFVAIGLGFLAAPFLAMRKARATVHLITSDRLINVTVGLDTKVESFPFKKINFVKRRSRTNGTGTLEIGYGVEKDSDGDPRPLTFDWAGIPNATQAEALIRDKAGWHRI
jgi:hypothetical protein